MMPAAPIQDERSLVEISSVSKKYCRNLRKSLLYGCADILNDLLFREVDRTKLRQDEFWALSDVSLKLERGQAIAIVGRNGAGKTSLLKLINGLMKPDTGEIRVRGRVSSLIALGAGFNPVLSGRENIHVNAAILGMERKEIEEQIESIIDFSGIREFIDSPVRNYSSGMKVRLGFAIASQVKPDILLLDEILAVGDVAFRRKCFDRLAEIRGEVGIIFVSHQLRQIEQLCDSAVYLDKGRIKHAGEVDFIIGKYLEDINQDTVKTDGDALIHREGSGEIRYTNIRTFGAVSGDNKLAHDGEDLIIEAEYSLYRPVDNVRFRVAIEDQKSGVLITAANCPADKVTGNGTIRCRFVHIALRPGSYSILLVATDLKLTIDYWRAAAVIVVTGTSDEVVQYSITDRELVYLPHTFEVFVQDKPYAHSYLPRLTAG